MSRRDNYRNFAELLLHEQEGRDFTIYSESRPSAVLILAPHGGGIEPGASEIARAIAADRFSCYCFEGIKLTGNEALHLTSDRFDEPEVLRLLQSVQTVVSIHGMRGGRWVDVGGLDLPLCGRMIYVLETAGFPARVDTHSIHPAHKTNNLCNRGRSGRGVQLEIGRPLRREMFSSLDRAGREHPTSLFHAFTQTIRSILEEDTSSRHVE